jgi:hypothetical protein
MDIFFIVHVQRVKDLLDLLVCYVLELAVTSHMKRQEIHLFNSKIILSLAVRTHVDKIKEFFP